MTDWADPRSPVTMGDRLSHTGVNHNFSLGLMELFLALCVGLGLSAASGFRVFVPPLVVSASAYAGHYTLPADLAWLGTQPAVMVFGVATAIEVLAYYVPWLDNALDTVEAPLATIAGTILTSSMAMDAFQASFPETSPLWLWGLAAIVGGGSAAVTESATIVTRLASTATTGGLANPAVSTMELLSSTVLAWLAIALPLLAAALCIGFLVWAIARLLQRRDRRRQSA